MHAWAPNAWVTRTKKLSQIIGNENQGIGLSYCSEWWAVLGSNQWPLPCETGVWGLRINDMRAEAPIATGTWYHVMSLDITQCHFRSVPKLSQTRDQHGCLMDRTILLRNALPSKEVIHGV